MIALGVGLAGAGALVVFAILVLRSTRLAFSVSADRLLQAARERQLLDDREGFHEAMALTLAERRRGNAPIVERLNQHMDHALAGLLAELAGLAAAAALAS